MPRSAPPAGRRPGIADLLRRQNGDGGWGYVGGGSWTEPTAYALLALKSCGEAESEYRAGLRWLARVARPDGGFAPHASVAESTWVTTVAALVEPGQGRAASWILQQFGRRSTRLRLLIRYATGIDFVGQDAGWPWFHGETSWVTPTALAVLALRRALSHGSLNPLQAQARIAEGQRLLLDRECHRGGWNYGNSEILGVNLTPTAETTGQALLALRGTRLSEQTIAAARALLQTTKSPSAAAWLQMGLTAHDAEPEVPGADRVMRTSSVMDIALPEIAAAALVGNNVLL